MAILILGGPDDEHAAYMFELLQSRGAEVQFLDSRSFPSQTCITYGPAEGKGAVRTPGGAPLAFEQIEAVYWRSYHGVSAPPLPDQEQAYIAQNDARSLFESLLIDLPARWVNGYHAFQMHQTKPVQLAAVARLGVPVPATFLGNDPGAVRQFVAQHSRCVFKPIQGGAHTRPVTEKHLTDENLQNLALAPVTVQEEVLGTDIRAFVVGGRVFACEIRTDALDFRDDMDPDIVPVELPAEVQDQSLKIADELRLKFTGIDWRREPQGRYVFLEANPSPMFLGFQQRTGLPLAESLAALLLGESEDRITVRGP